MLVWVGGWLELNLGSCMVPATREKQSSPPVWLRVFFFPQGQGSLRRNNLEHKWTLTPWLLPSYPIWNSVFSYLRWAHQFLPWMMSAQNDSWHMAGVQQSSSCLSFASVSSVGADWPSSLSLQLYPLSHLNVLTKLVGDCSVAMWPWQIPLPLWTSVSLSVLRDDYIG